MNKPKPIGEYLKSKYKMDKETYNNNREFVIKRLEILAPFTKYTEKQLEKKERVLAVAFSPEPIPRKRNIDPLEDHKIILDYKTAYSLADDKEQFPSIFDNEFVFGIKTNKRILTSRIYERYKWNNADIKGVVQLLALCSGDDRRVILGSGLHDFLLEYREELFQEFVKQDPLLTIDEYRWITSDTFRWVIESQGMGPVKSKFMSNVMDCFQKHCQKKKWEI